MTFDNLKIKIWYALVLVMILSQISGTFFAERLQGNRITRKAHNAGQTVLAMGGAYTFFALPIWQGQNFELRIYEKKGKAWILTPQNLRDSTLVRWGSLGVMRTASVFSEPAMRLTARLAIAYLYPNLKPDQNIKLEFLAWKIPSFNKNEEPSTFKIYEAEYQGLENEE